jgi:hypothetical protein
MRLRVGNEKTSTASWFFIVSGRYCVRAAAAAGFLRRQHVADTAKIFRGLLAWIVDRSSGDTKASAGYWMLFSLGLDPVGFSSWLDSR